VGAVSELSRPALVVLTLPAAWVVGRIVKHLVRRLRSRRVQEHLLTGLVTLVEDRFGVGDVIDVPVLPQAVMVGGDAGFAPPPAESGSAL
jgi:hypothetical protein